MGRSGSAGVRPRRAAARRDAAGPDQAWPGVPGWLPVAVWLASGLLVFHRPTETLLARHLLRRHRPLPHEQAVLGPLWHEVTTRAGVDGSPYDPWIEEGSELNAFATAGHLVGVTRHAPEHLRRPAGRGHRPRAGTPHRRPLLGRAARPVVLPARSDAAMGRGAARSPAGAFPVLHQRGGPDRRHVLAHVGHARRNLRPVPPPARPALGDGRRRSPCGAAGRRPRSELRIRAVARRPPGAGSPRRRPAPTRRTGPAASPRPHASCPATPTTAPGCTTSGRTCSPRERRRAATLSGDRPAVTARARLSRCTGRSRSPPAGQPGRSRCRRASSRCRRSRRPSTSRPWPPRWARPGCCGSGRGPYRPG